MPEGTTSPVFISGGILFSQYDPRAEASPPAGQGGTFAIDSTTYDIPGFTPPNLLSFGGYSEGIGFGFSRLGSFRMSTPVLVERADLDIFSFQDDIGAVAYELTAFRGTNLVASNSIPIPARDPALFIGRQHLTLACAPPFDSLFIQVLPTNAANLVGMDNVEFFPIRLGPVTPPQLRRIKTRGPNVAFEITGQSGRPIVLQVSRYMNTWKTLVTTNIPSPGTFELKVRRSAVHRFYRIVEGSCP